MLRRILISLPVLASVLAVGPMVVPHATADTTPPGGDAVVVAVIDTAFPVYHQDYSAAQMPQQLNSDPSDDLPLNTPADQWLTGFSKANMASYQPLNITLPTSPNDNPSDLTRDAAVWGSVQHSDNSKAAHVYWLPGTKIIAAATFGTGSNIQGTTDEHGAGTSTVSAGNLHGTCPECLYVLLTGDYEQAINWAMRQPWIDVITNSYGVSTGVVARDRVYNGCALDLQKKAAVRGQQIFFSSGNGVENAFLIPNSTLFSCQEGPDWITAVGAINSVDIVYVGPDSVSTFTNSPGGTVHSGRPADIASIGDSYPSAYTATTVSGTGATGFSGTSNATPVIAGMYAHALWQARQTMAGVSRTQSGGVVSVGSATCGTAVKYCAVGDGRLTTVELRNALFAAALHVNGESPGGLVTVPQTADSDFLAEGHGALTGRLLGNAAWTAEQKRITDPLFGVRKNTWKTATTNESNYAVALSYCSQHLWGSWPSGAWNPSYQLPGTNPATWPTRAAYTKVCPSLTAPPREPYVSLYGDPNAH